MTDTLFLHSSKKQMIMTEFKRKCKNDVAPLVFALYFLTLIDASISFHIVLHKVKDK